MDFGRMRFFIAEIVANLTRNAGMQLTAVGTVAVTVVLLGAMLFVRESVSHVGTQVLDQIEISVYLADTVTDAAAAALKARIASDPRIVELRYVPKEQGFKEMTARLSGAIDTSLMTSNPLPNAFRLRVKRPQSVPAVAASIQRLPGVARVNYARDVVAKLLRIADIAERVGLGIIGILLLVASVIISNTIRLTVFARRREIAIMQLVGATSSYIRAPFIFEGLIDGLLGAGLAVGILAAARIELLPKLIEAIPFFPIARFTVDEHLIVLELLCAGGLLGTVASWFAVGRYLRT
jgi:cell division transport system permease protein